MTTKTETKHTPGKLWHDPDSGDYYINDDSGAMAGVYNPHEVHEHEQPGIYEAGVDEAIANRDHLIACWNACESINPKAVPDLVDAASEYFSRVNPHLGGDFDDVSNTLRAAIAKATDKK